MSNEDLDYKLVVNTTFILDGDVEITIKNIDTNELNKLTKDKIIEIMMYKWYMYGVFDKCILFNEEYIITNKTKKKIELVRSNPKKDNN